MTVGWTFIKHKTIIFEYENKNNLYLIDKLFYLLK